MTKRRLMWALASALLLGACTADNGANLAAGGGPVVRPGASDRAVLAGSGSTLATAVVQLWARQYRAVAPGITIDFRPAPSDAAVGQQLSSGAADFGVSELPEAAGAGGPAAGGPVGGDPVAAVPAVASAVVVTYNLPGLAGLRLSPVTLSRIFDGSLTSWTDPGIAADNPGRTMPAARITPVTRSDPSSATLIFSRYLQAAARGLWTAGSAPDLAWPSGVGVAGPEAMTKAVQERPGAVGFASVAEAADAGLQTAMVRNAAGRFTSPRPASVDAFLIGADGSPQDLVLSVPYATTAPDAYPLGAFSYLLAARAVPGTDKARALRNFLRWILTDGQRSAERAGAAPLPLPLLVRTTEALQSDDLRPKR